jgi:hypothetical protein
MEANTWALIQEMKRGKVTDCLGLCLLVIALSCLVGPAIVANIYDLCGSYMTGFLVVGGLSVTGALLLPLVFLLLPKDKKTMSLP